MSAEPLVSIITPFWNAERYFQEAIESVLAQSYSRWELLLVDDGSTDGGTAIARAYAARRPEQVRYLEHPGHRNLGKSSTRNLGIRAARGAYIALLDADDVYLPQKLERQVAILEANPRAGMAYGPTQYWFSWTGRPRDARRDRSGRLGVAPGALYEPPHLLTAYLRDPGVVPCTCGLMARRSLVEAVGGFDERIQHLYEDQVLIARLCLAAPVYVDAGCWDRYRQHQGSTWRASLASGQEHASRLAYLRWLSAHLDERGVADPALRRALRRQFWPYDHPRLYGLRQGALAAARGGKRTIASALRRLGLWRAEEMELMP